MGWSYKIFRAFGIDVRVHATFLFIVAYFAYVWGVVEEPGGSRGALYGVVLVLILFALVVVHELTHSRVAQAYGIRVRSITLLPIGGVASMEEMPKEPRKEFWISLAGPMSNLIIGALMFVIGLFTIGIEQLTSWSYLSSVLTELSPRGAFVYIFLVNLSLAAFNLLPAFPMDGGRVLRALLAMRLNRAQATRIAAVLGQGFAILLGLWGILGGGIFLILIAIFLFFGAQGETGGERVAEVLGDLRIAKAVNTNLDVLRPDDTIGDAAARLFHSYQVDFPVVDYDGRLVGVLTRDRLISTLGQKGPTHPVGETMRTDFATAQLQDRVYDILTKMRQHGMRAFPVVEGGRLVGMVSQEDISEVYSLLSATGPEFARRVAAEPRAGEDSHS